MAFRFILLAFATVLNMTPASAQEAEIARYLTFGEGQSDTPITWVFDPNSGKTLGTGADLNCMKADLIFEATGLLTYANPDQVPPACPAAIRSGSAPLKWQVVLSAETGTVNLTIEEGAELCSFAIGRTSAGILLTTSCQQVPGQPRQFRYFKTPATNAGN